MVRTPPGPRKKPCKMSLKKGNYSPSRVKNALRAIDDGMQIRRASKLFGVPRTTLWNKINHKSPAEACHPGPVSMLPSELEVSLKDYILELARKGFPLDRESVLDSVKKLVDTMNLNVPFKDNRPGRKWFEGFLRRFPEISVKQAEHLGLARSLVSEHTIRNWFEEIKSELQQDGIDMKLFEDSSRVWNTDETAVYLSPKGGLVLAARGETTYSVSANSEKQCITVLFTVNASGELAPPLALFPYERIPGEISRNAPPNWGLGRTENGWMTGESFYEYMANVFIPYIEERDIIKPIVLFMDGHRSHITKYVSELCKERGIVLIALPPNATAILQPLDVAVFHPFKKSWVKVTRKWRIDHNGEEVNRATFCKLLNEALVNDKLPTDIQSGFRVTGLYPFNPDNVDYSKCVKKNEPHMEANVRLNEPESHLDYIEGKIDPFLLEEFKKQEGGPWNGDERATFLYELWQKAVADDNDISTGESVNVNAAISQLQGQENDQIQSPCNEMPISENSLETLSRPTSEGNTDEIVQNSATETTPTSSVTPRFTADNNRPSTSGSRRSLKDVFEDVLFYPGPVKKKTTRKRTKIPSVVTGSTWYNFNLENEKKKAEIEGKKKQRANSKLLSELNKSKPKRKKPIETSSESEDISEHENDSSSDYCEDEPGLEVKELDVSELKEGVFVLAQFKGGSRKTTMYKYVCIVQSEVEKCTEGSVIKVMGLNSFNNCKKTYIVNESDVSYVNVSDVLSVLPTPKLTTHGERVRYIFDSPINEVFEKC